MKKTIRFFEYSAGIILLLTALAKFISSTGHAKMLYEPDPVFQIQYRHVFMMVGVVELVIARMCLFGARPWLRSASVAWLATHFMLYRFALVWMGFLKPCPCFGSLTEMLPVSPETLDTVFRGVLAYLAIGSYGSLLWLGWQRFKSPTSSPPPSMESVRPAA